MKSFSDINSELARIRIEANSIPASSENRKICTLISDLSKAVLALGTKAQQLEAYVDGLTFEADNP